MVRLQVSAEDAHPMANRGLPIPRQIRVWNRVGQESGSITEEPKQWGLQFAPFANSERASASGRATGCNGRLKRATWR
jgi:hypothetical protein